MTKQPTDNQTLILLGQSKVTLGICALCLLVYAFEFSLGNGLFEASADKLMHFGASTGPMTIGKGEYGRLISYIFVHANILHILLNLYVLLDFGPVAEKSLGRKLYLFVFFFAGIVGALASIFGNQTQTTVGASAAILGLLGAVIYKSWFEKEKASFSRPQLIMLCVFLLYSLLLGFTSDLIDNAAHIGGFCAGAIVIATLYGTKTAEKPDKGRVVAASLLLPAFICALTFADYKRVDGNPKIEASEDHKQAIELMDKRDFAGAIVKLDAAQALNDKKDMSLLFDQSVALNEIGRSDEALLKIDSWIDGHKGNPSGYLQKGLILHKMGREKEAIEAMDEALKPVPFDLVEQFMLSSKSHGNPAIMYNNRAWFKLAANEPREALLDCDKAMSQGGDLDTCYDTRGVAYLMLKDYGQAQKDFDHALDIAQKLAKKRLKSRGSEVVATETGALYFHRALAKRALGDLKGAEEDNRMASVQLKYKPEPWESILK